MNPTAFSLAARAGSIPRGLHFSQYSGAIGDLQAVPLPQMQPPTDTRLPGAQPDALASAPDSVLPAVNTEGTLALDMDVAARRRFYNFLELSYLGSIEYKHGLDARGYRLLIEHENEIAPFGTGPDGSAPDLQNRPDADATQSNRYARRQRIAIYENHVAPIIEKYIGYIIRTAPKRSKAVEAELQRLKLVDKMTAVLRSALTLTQYFPGWDAATRQAGDGALVTEAIAKSLDPVNALKPYLISIDPRRVLDVDYDVDGNIIRFCYEEETRAKPSIVSKSESKYIYKEWFPTHWVAWEPVLNPTPGAENAAEIMKRDGRLVPTNGMKVRVKDAALHSFGRVPFVNLEPRFPTETLCDLNRALFNLTSLLFEELYNNTFTQFYILGARASDVKGSQRGTGNTMVIESPAAKIGTFGAVDGQAQAIREAIADVREQIYAVASMNESATKNVAESAEKKKRDLEALYTMLLSIVRTTETCENKLLVGMGLADWADEDSLTRYPDKLDIASVEDLLVEIAALKGVPFAPTSLKRSLTKQLASKMDPFGPNHDADVDASFEVTPEIVGSVVDLLTAKAITPSLVATALGIPEAQQADVVAQLEEHAAEPVPVLGPDGLPLPVQPDGSPLPPDEENDKEDDEENGEEDEPAGKPPFIKHGKIAAPGGRPPFGKGGKA